MTSSWSCSPRSKFDRLVFTERLVEAGLSLMLEARQSAKTDFDRARGLRNGLDDRVAGFCAQSGLRTLPRLSSTILSSRSGESWWIAFARNRNKNWNGRRAARAHVAYSLRRDVPHRGHAVLCGSQSSETALWISSTTGRRMTANNMATLISKLTLETLGVSVSPHLFRTSAASTAAAYGGDTPLSRQRAAQPSGFTDYGRALQFSRKRKCDYSLRRNHANPGRLMPNQACARSLR